MRNKKINESVEEGRLQKIGAVEGHRSEKPSSQRRLKNVNPLHLLALSQFTVISGLK